jgi:DNA-binding NtrC family response regulator
MPARIVVVLNEPEIAEEAASALGAQGQDALALVDPMTALEALEGAERIEVLVTGLDFAPGKPNGIALGRMARLKRPGIRVLFVGPADFENLAEGLGTFMASPVTVPQVVEGILRTLDTAPDIPAGSGAECGDRRQRDLGRPAERRVGAAYHK